MDRLPPDVLYKMKLLNMEHDNTGQPIFRSFSDEAQVKSEVDWEVLFMARLATANFRRRRYRQLYGPWLRAGWERKQKGNLGTSLLGPKDVEAYPRGGMSRPLLRKNKRGRSHPNCDMEEDFYPNSRTLKL